MSCQNWTFDLRSLFFWNDIKKVSSKLNLRTQGYLLLTWSLDHFFSSIPMAESLPLYRNQAASLSLLWKQTVSRLLPCKHPASPPLLRNRVDSPLLCTQMTSLAILTEINIFLIGIYNEKFTIYLPWGRLCVRSKRRYAQIQTIPSAISVWLWDLLSWRAINPELHLPWEGKAKRGR